MENESEVNRMTQWKKWLALLAVPMVSLIVLAGSAKFVCGLTGQESEQCCCEQRDGKLVCQNTGDTLDACCCRTK